MAMKLAALLAETPVAYYWAGFLAADGTVINNRRIALQLAPLDVGHVERFAEFIGGHLDNNQRATAQNGVVVPQFTKKFDFRPSKTFHPPKGLPGDGGDLTFAFVVGFIDGDGCIRHQCKRKDVLLSVKCHRTWLDVLTKMRQLLTGKAAMAYITKRRYALFNIADSQVLKRMKRRVLALSLPALMRKWDKIDLTFVGKRERGEQRVIAVRALLAKGLRNGEIAKELGIAPSTVTQIFNKIDSCETG